MMYAKKLRRKCGVRGCRSFDTYAIAYSREGGNSVVICKKCLKEGLEAVEAVKDGAVQPKATAGKAPSLFFLPEIEPAKEQPEEVEPDADQTATEPEEDEPTEAEQPEDGYVCPHCGKVCKSEQGLSKHIELKHKG